MKENIDDDLCRACLRPECGQPRGGCVRFSSIFWARGLSKRVSQTSVPVRAQSELKRSRAARRTSPSLSIQRGYAFIKLNLERCEISMNQAEVVRGDAIEFLRRTMMREDLMWDIAFFDPPYAIDYAPVLTFFGAGATLKRKSGVLVVEHHFENRLQDTIGVLRRWRIIRRGESCLSFYEQR